MANESGEVRSRILRIAGQAFAERGFRATTVREICRAAGVNQAAVNYYFGDKQQLYLETLRQAHEHRSEQVPLPRWPAGTPAEVKLRDFVRTMMMRMIGVDDLPWQPRLMMREILEPTAAARRLVDDYFRPHLIELMSILGELLPPDTPAYRQRQLAFSVIGQCLFYRFNERILGMLVPAEELGAHFAPDQLADHIAAVSLAALGSSSLFEIGDAFFSAKGSDRQGANQ